MYENSQPIIINIINLKCLQMLIMNLRVKFSLKRQSNYFQIKKTKAYCEKYREKSRINTSFITSTLS